MKKFFIFGAVAIVLSFAVALGVKAYNTTHNTLFYANLEALANPEDDNGDGGDGGTNPGGGSNPGGGGTSPGEGGGLDTNYTPMNYDCKIQVGANGKVRIVGIGVLHADADGYVTFSGARDCAAGGNMTCSPTSCVDIYSVIFD